MSSFAVLAIAAGTVTTFLSNDTYAKKLLDSIDYNLIAGKSQAQALSACLLSGNVWYGELDEWDGSLFSASNSGGGNHAYLWYNQAGHAFTHAEGSCYSLFSSSGATDIYNVADKTPSKYKQYIKDAGNDGIDEDTAKEDLAKKLEQLGYTRSSSGYFSMNASNALKCFTGYDGRTMLYTPEETMQLIAFYIDSEGVGYGGYTYYGDDAATACDVSGDHKASDLATAAANSGTTYVWLNVSTKSRCAVKPNKTSDGIMVYTINDFKYNGAGGERKTFKDLVGQWNTYIKWTWTDPEGEEGEDLIDGEGFDSTPNGSTSSGGSGDTPTCLNSAGSLGWILCPVLEGLSTVVEGLYDNVIAPQFLEIESTFMVANSSGSVYQGWQNFRNFANTIFAILFIIVILAQLTGIGISNYNVKKILPRLIMTVVLVNISFLLCQIAVDLSNILGYSLKETFINMANDTIVTVGGFVGNIGSALVSTVLTGALAGGAIYAASLTWEFWLFPLLLFLLGVIVSIFFFAIILGVRKAGILILVVLAPVAIVCYTLPNTKRFFDRWFKMLSSLLLVFPICGLLMGGGQYASTLLLGAAADEGGDVGFFVALVAMLVQVVPFFFIPSLVRAR